MGNIEQMRIIKCINNQHTDSTPPNNLD